MERMIADVNQKWENLSDDHKRLANRIDKILGTYLDNQAPNLSFLVIGTFGAGKTQFMIHIFKESIKKGMLPVYLLAEDLFRDIEGAPSQLKEKVNARISEIIEGFRSADYQQMKAIINASEGDLKNDLLNFLQENGGGTKDARVIVLVDELEGQYKILKGRIETSDNSPLREWLDDKSYLKLLSLAPSGVYELGRADESHLVKLVIPPVDIKYIRDKYELSAGKANALWWLSRGKARHIIKNSETIRSLSPTDGDYKLRETLGILDQIGQSPSEVPAIDFASLVDASKIKHLINLAPTESEKSYKGFKIEQLLSEGDLSNILQSAFALGNQDLALKVAHYFKFTSMLLSDQEYTSYLKQDEINHFMELSLDVLLENEFKSPGIEENMTNLLSIHEKIKSNSTLLLTTLITNQIEGISYTDLDKKFPFSMEEMRRLFPLPMANPIIKSIPEEVVREVEGDGMPVCRINENTLFFASFRDFKQYSETDEFKDKVFPEREFLVVLLSEEGYDEYERIINKPSSQSEQLLKWLNENGKLRFTKLPPLIKDFLLSLYGYQSTVPFNIQNIRDEIQARSSQEPLALRKFELYCNALQDLISDVRPSPQCFFGNKGKPGGIDSVWGTSQIKEESVAVAGLAQAFYQLAPTDRNTLVSLRKLFRTKQRGELADIKVGGGLPSLADDLLPRRDIKGNWTDAPVVEKLKDFWNRDEREKLEKLVMLVPLEAFKSLHLDPNYKRLLEAVWRANRNYFEMGEVNNLKRRLGEVISRLESIQRVEKKAQDKFKLGISFEDKYENIVKSLEGLKELAALNFNGKLPNHIFQLYLDAVFSRVEHHVLNIYRTIQGIDSKLDTLSREANSLIEQLKDKREIKDFIGDKLTYDQLKQEVMGLTVFDNDLPIQDIENELKDKISLVETLSAKFGELEVKLGRFKERISKQSLLGV